MVSAKTPFLGMKLIYCDFFLGRGVQLGKILIRGGSACNCIEDENMFFYPCRKNPYPQDVSKGLEQIQVLVE
jgi:hypothetical protein